MTSRMTTLGFPRSELGNGYCYPETCCASDDPAKKAEREKEIIYPEVRFEGKQADVMGAEDLDLGDEIEITLRLKVKGLRDDSRMVGSEKKRDIELCFQVIEASDYTVVASDSEESEDSAESDGSEETEDAPLNALLNRN